MSRDGFNPITGEPETGEAYDQARMEAAHAREDLKRKAEAFTEATPRPASWLLTKTTHGYDLGPVGSGGGYGGWLVELHENNPDGHEQHHAAFEETCALILASLNAYDGGAEVERLKAALREIAKGEGRFSTDQLTHASNTIEDMIAKARAALGAA